MSINPDDPRQPRIQLADTLRAEIQDGQLPAGKRLPSIRDIAARFDVAKNTAQAAIEILKAEGLLVAHGSRGVFVVDSEHPARIRARITPDMDFGESVDRRLLAAAGIPAEEHDRFIAEARERNRVRREYRQAVARNMEAITAFVVERAGPLPEGMSFEVVPEP